MNYCACGCGNPLTNRRTGAKFWSDECRNRAYSKIRIYSRPFVGLDGEGETRKGKHIYNLLASGTGKWIGNKQGLSTEECLDFLLDLPRGSNSGTKPIYVWFAMDYDVNMILADIALKGPNSIETLRAENTVRWRGYRITYLQRKIFRIARGTKRHTSFDVWGFFQSSFESALEAWNVEVPEIIAEGKASRSGFNRWSLDRIRAYNNAELEALQILCEKLRDSVTPLDLPIQSWHGPAALAAAWLRKNGAKRWLPGEKPTEEFHDVTTRAYFGGRIDVLGYGIVDPVYHYDIVSAYPAAIRHLPNLSKLNWKHQEKAPVCGRLYVGRIKWKVPPTYWGPFPWRCHDGSIRYPLEGEGWYWMPEIDAAIAKFGREFFEIVESYSAEGEIEFPFRNLIEESFAYRGELKRQGHPSATAVKLVLNSLYGKFAQTVGKPAFYSPIWAGLITSYTRAELMSVISEDTVCVMTDSIWSHSPLDKPLGKGLGEWESQDETKLILAEAGLYQAYSPNGNSSVWQRGFDRRNPVDISDLVFKWLYDDPTHKPIYTVSRFVGMGLASATSYPWRQWIEIPRAIEPVPLVGTTKRLPFFPDFRGEKTDTFIKLLPRPRDRKEISAPYSKTVQDASILITRLEDECADE